MLCERSSVILIQGYTVYLNLVLRHDFPHILIIVYVHKAIVTVGGEAVCATVTINKFACIVKAGRNVVQCE